MINSNEINPDVLLPLMTAMILHSTGCDIEDFKKDKENFLQDMVNKNLDRANAENIYNEIISVLKQLKRFRQEP